METIREIPYGNEITLLAAGMKILPVGNMLMIRQRGKKGRYIAREEKAEAFVRSIRSVARQAILGLQRDDNPVVRGVTFPLEGKTCQIRVDVYLAYGPEDRKALALSDVDNVLKGIYDALKEGPVYPTGTWGVIDDDRYIVGGYCEKGEAPDDGMGSRILLRISRARIRSADEMGRLAAGSIPILPPFRLEDQSRIIRPQIVGPD